MAEPLLISKDDFLRLTNVNGGVDPDKFMQYVKIAQDIHIQNYLGTKLLDKIKTDITNGTLTGNYLNLVNVYVKPMLVNWAMVEYLAFAPYTISNKGVLKHTAENAETVERNEVNFIVEKQRDIAQNYTRRFIDYMCYNSNLFPEYLSNTNNDVHPDRTSDFGGWFL